MLYMQEVERMDGYGEESYPAKVSWAWLCLPVLLAIGESFENRIGNKVRSCLKIKKAGWVDGGQQGEQMGMTLSCLRK